MKKRFQVFSLLIVTAILISSCSAFSALADIPETIIARQENINTEDVPASSMESDSEIAGEEDQLANTFEASEILTALQDAYTDIYDAVSPSVVSIQVIQTIRREQMEIPDLPELPDGFEFEFPEGGDLPQEYQTSSLGSGFVWDEKGHIVTNNHVVENADDILVTFSDGASFEAKLVGTDPESDLAVIKVDVSNGRLQPISVSDSTKIQVGDIAIAIGNPFGLETSMTTGIVSALGRSLPVETYSSDGSSYTIPDVIQTDAPINPGNSGGVLVDIKGRLMGVTTAIESSVRSNAGIGFVVPSIIVEKVVPALIEDGAYQHPLIGISGQTLSSEVAELMDLNAEQRGALVIDVSPNSPADEAGIQGSDQTVEVDGFEIPINGDVIIRIDGQPINDFEDIVAFLARYTSVGQEIEITVLRDGKEKTIDLTLVARENGTPEPEIQEIESEASGDAWMGIIALSMNNDLADAMDLPRRQTGVLIQQVITDGPADEGGLKGSYEAATIDEQEIMIGGDIIIEIENRSIEDMDDLKTALEQYKPGDEVSLTILRDGEEQSIEITLAAKPEAN